MTPDLAIAVSARDWAETLHRFIADHGGARVRARVLDAREALDEPVHVLIVEDLTSFLTPRLVAELHRAGRRLLGVHDPAEPWGADRLRELGVDDVATTATPPEELLAMAAALAATSGLDLDAGLARMTTGADDHEASPAGSTDVGALPASRGPVTVVGGPSGGPGATEVALAAAAMLRADGRRTVLIDGDDVAPSLAQRLGLALHPNLRTAIDVVQHHSGRLEDCLQRASGLPVIAGLPHPADAAELRPAEAVDVCIDVARACDHVVVNVGHRLEDRPRYALARALVAAADTVVAVGAPSPVGLRRLLDWIADVHALNRAPLHVAISRAPGSSFRRGELEHELRRTFSPPHVSFLPEDRRVHEAAWDGVPVPPGPYTRAVAVLARELDRSPRRVGLPAKAPA